MAGKYKGLNLEDIFSHEFKTPIAIIMNNINNIERSYSEGRLDEDELRQTSSSIRRCCNLLSMLSQNMALTVSSGKKNKAKPVFYDVAKQIREICFMSKEMFRDNNIKINFISKRQSINFFADPDMMLLIITNLISNAVKYNVSEEKVIDVKLDIIKKDLIIRVCDNGIGIPKEDINKIFEKYYRSDNRSDMPASGLGLGLYIVSQAVKAHGGTLTATSSKKGSAFKILIPHSEKVLMSAPAQVSLLPQVFELCYADILMLLK